MVLSRLFLRGGRPIWIGLSKIVIALPQSLLHPRIILTGI